MLRKMCLVSEDQITKTVSANQNPTPPQKVQTRKHGPPKNKRFITKQKMEKKKE
jgi:hypothetical protein